MGKKTILVLLAICIANLVYLDYYITTQKPSEQPTEQELVRLIQPLIPTLAVAPGQEVAVATGTNTTPTPTLAPSPAPQAASTQALGGQPARVQRESFVTVGNGSFNSEYDWGDVPGAQVTINGGSYGAITSAVFEATVNEPNGAQDVSLRLYNVTDGHPVWNSEMFFPSGGATRFLVSPQITIEPKAAVYQVQMKTQFRTNASLDLARIHLFSY